ncbi:MAG TPA: hypothetical protein IAC04_05105 [Candidatus Coprenecus stercoravium]|uniref:Uncharacterized protein n=1 Tax=Candidatus Coprenecus stercoravium TaxID=2840735 RepID=A0A9D2K8V6_9BACT|nr:hypothetical protein [Candidatus Coprenecus stercoravium]
MRNWFLTRILQRKALKKLTDIHHGKYVSLSSAHLVGLIVNTENPDTAEAVKTFLKRMAAAGKACRVICLDFGKEPLTDQKLLNDSNVTILRRRNLNWYGIPRPESTAQFLQQPFDILIDLTSGKRLFQADFLLKKANAALLIGIENNRISQYDMVVSGNDGGESRSERLIDNIINYLTTIH